MINDLGVMAFGDLWSYPFKASVWGTAGQWIASIFAGASVLVALSIVKSDRSKDDWTNARKIVTWTGFASGPPSKGKPRDWTVTLEVTNNSDRPIYEVKLHVTPKADGDLKDRKPSESDSIDEIHPGENKKATIVVEGPGAHNNHLSVADMIEDVVYFTSENGITWEKSSRGKRLRIYKEPRFLAKLLKRR